MKKDSHADYVLLNNLRLLYQLEMLRLSCINSHVYLSPFLDSSSLISIAIQYYITLIITIKKKVSISRKLCLSSNAL